MRSPTLRFHLEGRAHYVVGAQSIDYELSLDAAGPDRTFQLDETTGGTTISSVFTYVNGILYSEQAPANAWTVEGGPQAQAFGSQAFRLQPTLILADLGQTNVDGNVAYRLQVVSGISLAPPAFTNGTIGSPHDRQDHLEFTIDEAGTLFKCRRKPIASGLINGSPGVAQGTVTYEVSELGTAPDVEAPQLPPNMALPSPQPESSLKSPTLIVTPLAARSVSIGFPGYPVETTSTVQILGSAVSVEQRSVKLAFGPLFTETDAVLPNAFVASHSLAELLMGAEEGATKNAGAQLVGSFDTTVAGTTALAFVGETPTTLNRDLVFLVGDRQVELSVAGSLDQVASITADQFLASVQPTQ